MFSLSTAIQASEDSPIEDLNPQNMSMSESDQTIYNNPCPENNCCFNCCQKTCECIDTYACTRFCAICCVESCKFMVDPPTLCAYPPYTYADRCVFCCIKTII